jgi:hypothetical protein
LQSYPFVPAEIPTVFNVAIHENSLGMLQYKRRDKFFMQPPLKGIHKMKIQNDDAVGKQHPVFVFFDVKRRDKKFEHLWTDDQKSRATKMKDILYELYGCRPRVFMNIRRDFIAIKVAAPKPSEKNSDAVLAFNKMLTNGNLVKNVEGGVVYEFRCV